jgi:uncharacterized protein (DUF608 family)
MVRTSKKTVKSYKGKNLNHVAFPLGGIGAGMICIEGTGMLSSFSLFHKPEVFKEACVFSALTIKTRKKKTSLVLEGTVQDRKIFGAPGTGNGASSSNYGLPRFSDAEFSWEFPFAYINLKDPDMPLTAKIMAWSPFIPLDADNSSLPCAALEFTFSNSGKKEIEAVYSFNAKNFIAANSNSNSSVKKTDGGFIFSEKGTENEIWQEAYFCASVNDPDVKVNPSWFRGGWFDSRTIAWKDIESGECPIKKEIKNGTPSAGATIYLPFKLNPGESRKIKLMLSWYVPYSQQRTGQNLSCSCSGNGGTEFKPDPKIDFYRPWYVSKFNGIDSVAEYFRNNYDFLREESKVFSKTFYASTIPEEITEAIAANLSIFKSPTVLRQDDGRLWCWEGCCDSTGCCSGTCTHVWNYAQATAHLFPSLERTLRNTEFNESQDENGHQNFRASLPIRPADHNFHAAADGQLGGIMKVYREWRISGDSKWLAGIWPKVRKSMDYCIRTWDPDHKGATYEPHHNTYDIEFWGADGMHSTFYLGALEAAARIAEFIGEDSSEYREIFKRGVKILEKELFNGKYFIQKTQWKGLHAGDPSEAKTMATSKYSEDAVELFKKEGPKYQYGAGCLSDGILGAWIALVCGLGEFVDRKKMIKHLISVFKHNFKTDLSKHVNPQRSTYAIGEEGGLLLCTWPKGDKNSLPFPYSDEVWTGIEYQVAAHLISFGYIAEGLEIVSTLRKRYDGSIRNPFNEYECGHWYGRALASYGLLYCISGIRYDAVEKILYVTPRVKGNFSAFFCAEGAYGTAGLKNGKPFFKPTRGKLEIKEFKTASVPL